MSFFAEITKAGVAECRTKMAEELPPEVLAALMAQQQGGGEAAEAGPSVLRRVAGAGLGSAAGLGLGLLGIHNYRRLPALQHVNPLVTMAAGQMLGTYGGSRLAGGTPMEALLAAGGSGLGYAGGLYGGAALGRNGYVGRAGTASEAANSMVGGLVGNPAGASLGALLGAGLRDN